MATVTASGVDVQASERRFYSRMAIFLVALVFLGFAPSFYLKDVVPPYPRPNPSLPLSVILHGSLFTLWMAAFVAQTQLVAAGRRDLHMKLGSVSMVLAVILVPIMYLTSVWQVSRANQPPFTTPLGWTIVPLAVIVPYSIVVWQGWARRRQAQWHKRLMLSASIIVVMGPSIGRLPIAPPTVLGMSILLLLGLAIFIPLFVWDRRTCRHIHPATWLGVSMAVMTVALPLAVFWSGANWDAVAAALPGVGG